MVHRDCVSLQISCFLLHINSAMGVGKKSTQVQLATERPSTWQIYDSQQPGCCMLHLLSYLWTSYYYHANIIFASYCFSGYFLLGLRGFFLQLLVISFVRHVMPLQMGLGCHWGLNFFMYPCDLESSRSKVIKVKFWIFLKNSQNG